MNKTLSSVLSREESIRLKICEEGIKRGLKTFVETGRFLLEIRDNKLYREEFGTFDLYCQKKLGIVRQHAYRLIEGAKTVDVLSPMGGKVPNERQVRPLTGLPVPVQRKAFKAATETAKNQHREVTGKDVRDAVARVLPPVPQRKPILDMLGREIPAKLVALWNRREAPLEVCKLLSSAKSILNKAHEENDQAFVRLQLQSEVAVVNSLYNRIKESAFHCVCGLCQGVGCKACKTGLMSRQQWEQLVPQETKDMILKGIKR